MLFRKSRTVRILCILAVFHSAQAIANASSILEQYVNADDGAFSYQAVTSISQPGLTAYVYKLTSQKWRTESEVNRTLWEHRLTIIVPDSITNDKAILFTFGGENTPDFLAPDPTRLELLGTFALLSGSIAVQVSQVPNQPLVFADEPSTGRVEDDLVAYSWDTAMGTNDYTWTAYLPMTKSVVKAMDAVQLIANDLQLSQQPNEFVLVGFSKRGAIAWLSAAIDSRVTAISPGVFDTLNFAPSTENQRKTYGAFAEPLTDYDNRNVLDRFRTREGQQLTNVVDPYAYRHVISIPKYIINASGDQFYPPDSSQFYFGNLQGESLLRYLPNTDHGGSSGGFENAIFGLLAWYQRIASETPRPQISWNLSAANSLSLSISDPTATALLWSANNANAKDFRLETFGPNWQSEPVNINPNGNLQITLQTPEFGWTGYFLEITTPGIADVPEKYTTPVFILPGTAPFNLEQPKFSPKSKAIWIQTLYDIINQNTENSELVESFPIRSIGDETVPTIHDAHALLIQNPVSNKIEAQQECLVTRLNIKDGQIDWYSKPLENSSIFLWSWWNLSDFFYRARLYSLSKFLCASISS